MRPALVGVDIGTSSVKVVACSPEGTTLASAAEAYGVATPAPDFAEQDAETIAGATLRVLRAVLQTLRDAGHAVTALGWSCAMHGLLPVNAAGEPLGPLITWLDTRSAAIARRWRTDGTAAHLYARTGAPVHPMLPSCKLRWFAEHDPGLLARAARFVSIKELLVYRLTGEWLVDYGMASGTGLFDPRRHGWDPGALASAGIGADRLSSLVAPSTALRAEGPVAREVGLDAATAIVLGSSDGALANLGVGAVGDGDVAVTLGTSGAVRVVADEAGFDPAGRTFCYAYDDARYLLGGPTSSGGAVLARLHALILPDVAPGDRFGHAVELATQAPPGANGLTFLPFLAGERAPYWDPHLRGGLIGLDLRHDRGDVARAGFEGVVLALAAVFELVRPRTRTDTPLRLGGGLMRAPLVRQLTADFFGREAVLFDHDEASAFGAALTAGIATRTIAGDCAVAAMLQPRFRHEPDGAAAEAVAETGRRYAAAVARLSFPAAPVEDRSRVRDGRGSD